MRLFLLLPQSLEGLKENSWPCWKMSLGMFQMKKQFWICLTLLCFTLAPRSFFLFLCLSDYHLLSAFVRLWLRSPPFVRGTERLLASGGNSASNLFSMPLWYTHEAVCVSACQCACLHACVSICAVVHSSKISHIVSAAELKQILRGSPFPLGPSLLLQSRPR